MVIVGIGVRPNIQLVNESGVKVNRGILVDGMMRTNFENVFAAGDVAEGENLVTVRRRFCPIGVTLVNKGRIAGLNMAGCAQRYEGGLERDDHDYIWTHHCGIGVSRLQREGLTELRIPT